MTRFLLIALMCLFLVVLAKLVLESEWYLVASLIVGLLTARDEIGKLFADEEDV